MLLVSLNHIYIKMCIKVARDPIHYYMVPTILVPPILICTLRLHLVIFSLFLFKFFVEKWEKKIFVETFWKKVVILPWGSMDKMRRGVPTKKGSTGHTCRSRTTLPPPVFA